MVLVLFEENGKYGCFLWNFNDQNANNFLCALVLPLLEKYVEPSGRFLGVLSFHCYRKISCLYSRYY